MRPIERRLEGQSDVQAQAARRYGLAVRRALTDDGRAPLAASSLKLKGRLEGRPEAIADSLDRVEHARQLEEPPSGQTGHNGQGG